MKLLSPSQSVSALRGDLGGSYESGQFICSAATGDTYVTVNNGSTSFYFWFNLDGAGVDPAPGGTGVEIALGATPTAAQTATGLAAGIDAQTSLKARADGVNVYFSVESVSNVTDASVGDSGFTLKLNQGQGLTGFGPGENLAAEDPVPATLS